MRTTPHNVRLFPRVERDIAQVAPELRQAFRDLIARRTNWPLFLHGPPGAGKTLAALCLADVAETAGYWTPDSLAELVMRRDDESLWRRVACKELAILDELATRSKTSDLEYSIVKRYADCRELEAGRRAIYIANVAPEDIARHYDDRIASRILCGTVFHLNSDDRRMRG